MTPISTCITKISELFQRLVGGGPGTRVAKRRGTGCAELLRFETTLTLLVALTTVGCTNLQSDSSSAAVNAAIRPAPTPTPSASPPLARKGINAGDLRNLTGTALTAAVNDLVAVGVGWVRMDFPWSEIEVTKGVYNTAGWDAAVQALVSQNIQVLGIIDYAPSWANGGNSQMTPPTNPSDFGAFAAFLAQRYSTQGVHTWEIWNEPNLQEFWATGANAVAYTLLLKAAYPAIKAADGAATIITAGLAPAASDGSNLTPMDFLTGVYGSGGKAYFDAVGIHPYTYPYMPDDTTGGAYWWAAMTNIRTIMTNNNDSAKKIWMTEYGAPTDGPTGDPFVTEANQALMLTKAFTMNESYDWAGPIFWYDLHDAGTDTSTMENFYGIMRFDGSHKPSYTALQAIPPH